MRSGRLAPGEVTLLLLAAARLGLGDAPPSWLARELTAAAAAGALAGARPEKLAALLGALARLGRAPPSTWLDAFWAVAAPDAFSLQVGGCLPRDFHRFRAHSTTQLLRAAARSVHDGIYAKTANLVTPSALLLSFNARLAPLGAADNSVGLLRTRPHASAAVAVRLCCSAPDCLRAGNGRARAAHCRGGERSAGRGRSHPRACRRPDKACGPCSSRGKPARQRGSSRLLWL
jgi:hypothetical protein